MNKTEAAAVLARHIAQEAAEQGVSGYVTDEFIKNVVSEARLLHGTRWNHVADAADLGPAIVTIRKMGRVLAKKGQL